MPSERSSMQPSPSTARAEPRRSRRLVGTALACGVAVALAGLATYHLVPEVSAVLAGDGDVTPEVSSLPFDAPALTAARVRGQIDEGAKTQARVASTSNDEPIEFKDW